MENFNDMFDSVKAETLRLLVRDLGQKSVGKRDDMLEFLKNRLFSGGKLEKKYLSSGQTLISNSLDEIKTYRERPDLLQLRERIPIRKPLQLENPCPHRDQHALVENERLKKKKRS